jgi:hypothetical protein
VTDITGGTKARTAGLALAAIRWPCRISYVGGTEVRGHAVVLDSELAAVYGVSTSTTSTRPSKETPNPNNRSEFHDSP